MDGKHGKTLPDGFEVEPHGWYDRIISPWGEWDIVHLDPVILTEERK